MTDNKRKQIVKASFYYLFLFIFLLEFYSSCFCSVEYYGKQVEEKDIIARVKKAWTRSGKKVGDIKEMDLYIKPEENAVYYVINGTETGAVEFE